VIVRGFRATRHFAAFGVFGAAAIAGNRHGGTCVASRSGGDALPGSDNANEDGEQNCHGFGKAGWHWRMVDYFAFHRWFWPTAGLRV
jgi:hypothetical protein